MANHTSNSINPIPPDACQKGLPQLTPLAETYQNINQAPLAMVTIPLQPWETIYHPEFALQAGTIFSSLSLPFGRSGGKVL